MNTLYRHEELCQNFFANYIDEFGSEKLAAAHDKIRRSNKVSSLINRSEFLKAVPSAEHFINTVPAIPYFFFAKDRTLALGCILALLRWNDEVNSVYEVMNESELYGNVMKILITYRIKIKTGIEVEDEKIPVTSLPTKPAPCSTDLTYEQKCAIIATIWLFWGPKDDMARTNREREILFNAISTLEFKKTKTSIDDMTRLLNEDRVHDLVASLQGWHRDWYITTLDAMYRADPAITQERISCLRKIQNALRIEPEDFYEEVEIARTMLHQ